MVVSAGATGEVRVGCDVQSVAQVAAALDRLGGRYLARVLSQQERDVWPGFPPAEWVTARYAAKEAVLKVLGTGWRGGIAWTDVEIVKDPSGQPKVVLTGECARIAKELGISRWHVSLSHIETHATASAIGMRGD